MNYLYIAIAAFVGSMIAGTVGWLKDGTPFNFRKYLSSILSGIGAAIIFALAYNFDSNSISVYDLLAAIAAGAGTDNLVNRISGIVK